MVAGVWPLTSLQLQPRFSVTWSSLAEPLSLTEHGLQERKKAPL